MRKATNIELYKTVYLIRSAEAGIRRHYAENDMKTPMHMSMGEEAVIVGVCHALGFDSQVFGTYRSHALYLAKAKETDRFFAEMYGKASGTALGKAGSMHMSDRRAGLLCSGAIVASTIPLAVGAAFANKRLKESKLTAAFFGDGAMESGGFWESLNLACAMRLPVLFVCNDNDLAVHTEKNARHGFKSAVEAASAFECGVFSCASTDVEQVLLIAEEAVSHIRSSGTPAFLHCRWYRFLEHVGVNEDFDAGYRSRAHDQEMLRDDPVHVQRSKLLMEGWLTEADIRQIETAIDSQVEKSILLAKAAPFSDTAALYEGLYV